ncbi:unnamed protein product [Mytilus edulis]|uniref:Uncharacterized protein n=1 Tax=Mytilus edulis TaxID=6550 RepID=A0A8S3SK64_MYTED|nr:unnamed protein product [Mytilus edulis]
MTKNRTEELPEELKGEITPEKLIQSQKEDSDIKVISDYKNINVKPGWQDISRHGNKVKSYWNQWDSLEFRNGRPKEENNDGINYSTYAKRLQEKVESIHSFARRRIYKSSDLMKKCHDRNVNHISYENITVETRQGKTPPKRKIRSFGSASRVALLLGILSAEDIVDPQSEEGGGTCPFSEVGGNKEQDTERHNIVDTEYILKDKQEQRDDFLELFKGQLNEFNHSLVRGFDVMSNQMQNLIGIMPRKTDDSQDMSRRQVAEPINREETNSNVENRQERNIAHKTRSQEFNGNNRSYDVEPRAQGSWFKFNKTTLLTETEEQIINIPQEAKPMVQIDMTRNQTAPGKLARSTLGDKDRQTV